MFEAAERNGGYGGIKMTGEPLPQCQFRVEPSYEHVGPDHECVNPGFFDCGDARAGEQRAFDLRDAVSVREPLRRKPRLRLPLSPAG